MAPSYHRKQRQALERPAAVGGAAVVCAERRESLCCLPAPSVSSTAGGSKLSSSFAPSSSEMLKYLTSWKPIAFAGLDQLVGAAICARGEKPPCRPRRSPRHCRLLGQHSHRTQTSEYKYKFCKGGNQPIFVKLAHLFFKLAGLLASVSCAASPGCSLALRQGRGQPSVEHR
jgi:hypothetical protein